MSASYPADYTNLVQVRTLKAIASDETGDDAMLIDFIHEASAFIDTWTGRHFVPYVATNSYGWSHVENSYDLNVRDDLLAVTTLTNGDSAVISSGYSLRPDNVYPKSRIELATVGATTWALSYRESRITVLGVWGYHEAYSVAWRNRSTLSAALTDSATTMTVANLPYFGTLDYALIDSEQVQITDISGGAATITRGVNGTTAASHLINTTVKLYQQNPTITFCANQIVKWMYERRDKAEGAIQLAQDLGVVIVQELPQVEKLLNRFRPIVRNIWAV